MRRTVLLAAVLLTAAPAGDTQWLPAGRRDSAVTRLAIRVETEGGPVRMRGALTIEFERVDRASKILHEHLGLSLPEV